MKMEKINSFSAMNKIFTKYVKILSKYNGCCRKVLYIMSVYCYDMCKLLADEVWQKFAKIPVDFLN